MSSQLSGVGTPSDESHGSGVNVIYSNRFIEHRAPTSHPEQPTRVSVAARALSKLPGVRLLSPRAETSREAYEVALEAIKQVHDPLYVEDIRVKSEEGGSYIDSDTYVHPATFETCVIAAGSWIDAVRDLVDTGRPAFALTRPPGHHALRDQAMGFCIFNFAVIAAKVALDHIGMNSVAILDWDVHHGNGVADLVKDDPRIRYCSLHQDGAFPLTGAADDTGPLGNLRHIPLPPYTDMRTYHTAFVDHAVPFLREFEPELLIVCAGYDALAQDELANLCLTPKDYEVLSSELMEAFGASRIVFGLEGGYDPTETAEAIIATLRPFL